MRLADAERVLDAAGDPIPPQVLVDGVRSLLIYTVRTTGPNPRVFIDGAATGQLGGVLGSPTGTADLAAAITAFGMAAAVAQPLVGGPGLRHLTIVLGEPDPPTPTPSPTSVPTQAPAPPQPNPPSPAPAATTPPSAALPSAAPPAETAPVQSTAEMATGGSP